MLGKRVADLRDNVVWREGAALYRRWSLERRLPTHGASLRPPDRDTNVVLYRASRSTRRFEPQVHIAELAFMHELAECGDGLAIVDDPSALFGKTVVWFLPSELISPRLWDYSRQVHEFAVGLERQGNRLLCSSDELLFWENKAYMQERLAEVGAATPSTVVVAAVDAARTEVPFEPVLVKEEHSAGSAGVHYFARSADARRFLAQYRSRPGERLLLQEVVPGATRDLRLTMVGERPIDSATFWRVKHGGGPAWTTTATKYGSTVEHANIPEAAIEAGRRVLRALGVRVGGIDLMWADDDVGGTPLILEVSPYFQPNPPKPARYAEWTYSEYKRRPYVSDGYFSQQYVVFREIASTIVEQGLL
jgi:hypothetical protein